MTRRRWVAGAIGLLAVLVALLMAWREPANDAREVAGSGLRPQDFAMPGVASMERFATLKRDPFYGGAPPSARAIRHTAARPPAEVPAAPVAAPAPPPALEVKYIGYLWREGRAHALLLFAGEPLVVAEGNSVGGRYIVERIASNTLFLRDRNDSGATTTRIDLSGDSQEVPAP